MAKVLEKPELLARAGADAIIVQDLGIARLARQVCPELPLHASTQMTISSAEAAAIAQTLGVTRVVLSRELSIAESRAVSARGVAQLNYLLPTRDIADHDLLPELLAAGVSCFKRGGRMKGREYVANVV